MKKRLNCEWTITPSEPPRYRHRCSKCKTMTSFYCGEKFRINGQKKTVDVWLIYKCERCDSTFNVDIFSRVRPETIEKEEYDNFQCNDVDTSWRYAFRKDVIEQNKVDADFSRITYTMGGDILSLEQMCEAEEDLIEFEIKSLYDIDLKLTFVICENLNVSMKQLEKMLSDGVLSIFPQEAVKKAKIKNNQKVIINKKKLAQFLGQCEDEENS